MVIANVGIPRVKPNFFKNENWEESLLETFRQHVNMKIGFCLPQMANGTKYRKH